MKPQSLGQAVLIGLSIAYLIAVYFMTSSVWMGFTINALVIVVVAISWNVTGGFGGLGGFLLTVGTAFGYAAGWTPYAADYTRYLPSAVSPFATGFFASTGLFVSCVVLEIVGAASTTFGAASLGNPTASFKDRASAMVVAHALEMGVSTVATASTGNAAAALAGVCAATPGISGTG